LLTMIFWQLWNLNCYCKNMRKFWNTMEVSWFFLLGFFLYYSSFFSFDDHVATFFKEGVEGKRTIWFFITSILNITLLICVAIIVVVEHMNCCYYYCDYFGNKLRKKYVGKVSTTKMSYLWACS
jgi:hypothetical protein